MYSGLSGELDTVPVTMVRELEDDWMWAGLNISALNRKLVARGLELRKMQGRPVLCPIGKPTGYCLYYFSGADQLVGYFEDPSLFAQEASDYTVPRQSWEITPAEQRAMDAAASTPDAQGVPEPARAGFELPTWAAVLALVALPFGLVKWRGT